MFRIIGIKYGTQTYEIRGAAPLHDLKELHSAALLLSQGQNCTIEAVRGGTYDVGKFKFYRVTPKGIRCIKKDS